MDGVSIDVLHLSRRSQNALHRHEIHTVEELCKYSEEDLNSIRNLGEKSIDEILETINKIKVEGLSSFVSETVSDNLDNDIDDFESWIQNKSNKDKIKDLLEKSKTSIDILKKLDAKSYNILKFNNFDFIYQFIFMTEEELMNIPRMNSDIVADIMVVCNDFLLENKNGFKNKIQEIPIDMFVKLPENMDAVLAYVNEFNVSIDEMNLSARPYNRLKAAGYEKLSDIILLDKDIIASLPSMGKASLDEILNKIDKYLSDNENAIRAAIAGDKSAFINEKSIESKILRLYNKDYFVGYSFKDFISLLDVSEDTIPLEVLKDIIGKLLSKGELEYVDYRCYRNYDKFADVVKECPVISERSRDCILKKLSGYTLESIGQELDVTRERVRQIIKKDREKVKNWHCSSKGKKVFDEDYYAYLYTTYFIDRDKCDDKYLLHYFDLFDYKQGDKDIHLSIEDYKNIDVGLRQRIEIGLNKNKVYIDGEWVEATRKELEKFVIKKFCKDSVCFDDYVNIYNTFLEEQGVEYDEKLYYTEAVFRTRENKISDDRFVLWSEGRKLRYYEIDARDYADLYNELNLDLYENTEISTVKLVNEHPDILKEYDIRNQYELHNLLRKTVSKGSFHDIDFGKMPNIKFGEFDKTQAIRDLLLEYSPISSEDLINMIYDQYGYNPYVIQGTYLTPFAKYYFNGMYSIDQKSMNESRRLKLKEVLTDDFYYIDEIRKKYVELFPDGDVDEINAYNLKMMGFQVYERYAIQNFDSLDQYFEYLFTKDEIFNMYNYRKRFLYVVSFSNKLWRLKRDWRIIEYDPDEYINITKLEKSGMTEEMIQDFCDDVYDYVKDNTYFTIHSLNSSGFNSEIYEYGFSEWFYANLLIGDARFSISKMFGNIVIYKGEAPVTKYDFLMSIVGREGSIDIYDLMDEVVEVYGCKIKERAQIFNPFYGTEVYFDKIMDKLYADKEDYYREIDEMGGYV